MKKYCEKFRRHLRSVFSLALLASVLFHVVLLLKSVELPTYEQKTAEKSKKKEERRIKVSFKESKEKKQIVQTEKTESLDKKKETRFLSDRDQAVDREEVSKKVGKFKKAGKGVKHGSTAKAQPGKKSQSPQKTQKKAHTKKAKEKADPSKSLSWEALAKANQQESKKAVRVAKRASIQKGVKGGAKGHSGMAQTNDHIEDIPLGDMTQLNTIEYKYYGFYNRIREKLERHWGKTLRQKAKSLNKDRGRAPASANKITSLIVTIDSQGQIVDIKVKSTSGVRAFDEAAVESFSKAGPFPNPPSGMVKNGRAQIEWGFVVKS